MSIRLRGRLAVTLAAGVACGPGTPSDTTGDSPSTSTSDSPATDGSPSPSEPTSGEPGDPTGEPGDPTGEPGDPTGAPTTDTTGPIDPTDRPPEPECDPDDCGPCSYCGDGGYCVPGDGCYHDNECYDDEGCAYGEVCEEDFDLVCQEVAVIPLCDRQALELSFVDLAGPADALVVADLDGDDDLDVAVARPGEVEVLLGDGLGGLAPGGVFPTGLAGDEPVQIAAADFDGDGELDLAVLRPLAVGELALLFGQDAEFTAPVPGQLGHLPLALFAGDVDGDGAVDLAAHSGELHDLVVRLGDGLGGFGTEQVALAGSFPAAAMGDMDNDGALDLAARSTFGPDVAVHRFEGGAYNELLILDALGTTEHSALMTADFEGDQTDEVIGHRIVQNVEIVTTWISGWPVDRVVEAGARPAAAGDVDGDGCKDVISLEPTSAGFSVQFTDSTMCWLECTQSYFAGSQLSPRALAAGDLDGDGKAEIVAGNATHQLALVRAGP
ncbi:FG-GAP-like repeat-containing protein [Nannocystis pusilla]|uniref:FG-GAP-like repeat-containing protein n=1 Tax=Nannocystis pusilla TaxID=889268 RepID=A0ABS7TPQ8_9BACT|nr:FG-GAP-like repeat-containing protein [Nannocystis pusilla]MBZ5710202.1 FG-GAP-like repeat-containing protein [Nannocystis pusilla]